jgi:hypothetical protein
MVIGIGAAIVEPEEIAMLPPLPPPPPPPTPLPLLPPRPPTLAMALPPSPAVAQSCTASRPKALVG